MKEKVERIDYSTVELKSLAASVLKRKWCLSYREFPLGRQLCCGRGKKQKQEKTPHKRFSTLWLKLYKAKRAKVACSENYPFYFLTNGIWTIFRNPKADFLTLIPTHSAFHVLFFHPSPEGWAVHRRTGSRAPEQQEICRWQQCFMFSVHIQEVCGADLTLGEGCAAQQHIQGFSTAIPHTRACLGADCSPAEREQQEFVGVVCAHPYISMHKIPKGRMKGTSDNPLLHASGEMDLNC